MKNIFAIFKKEMRRFFTDKRMLLMLIMPGLVIFIVYSIMGSVIGNMISTTDDDTIHVVYSKNQPEIFKSFDANELFKVEMHNSSELDEVTVFEKISNGDIDLYIVYEEGFIQKVSEYDPSSGEQAPQVEMYYNSAHTTSAAAYSYYASMLDGYESTLSNKFDINSRPNIYDLAKEDDLVASLLTSLLPFMLIMFLFSGSMAVVTESIAGEKERGTIASLLIAPIQRHELALGKISALSVTSLVSASSSLVGLLTSFPLLLKGMGVDLNISGIYGIGEILALFGVLVVTAVLFTVVLSLVSAISKTVKEATSYAAPIMMVVMVLGVSTMVGTSGSTNIGFYFIPIYNTVRCLSDIFSLAFNPIYFVITIAANIVFIVGGVFLLAKMFDSERIMFNK